MILISTLAGPGRTFLLAEWRSSDGYDVRAAWLVLDSGDNDLPRFRSYLVAAFETIQPGYSADVLDLFQPPQPPVREVVLVSLVNYLSTHPQEFVLILDDFHLLRSFILNPSSTIFARQSRFRKVLP